MQSNFFTKTKYNATQFSILLEGANKIEVRNLVTCCLFELIVLKLSEVGDALGATPTPSPHLYPRNPTLSTINTLKGPYTGLYA